MSITRTFEVTITKRVRINIPDAYDTPEMITDWRSGLWDIDGVDDMAEYAARLVADGAADYNNEGVGRMLDEVVATHRQDIDPLTVTYSVLSEDIEATLE